MKFRCTFEIPKIEEIIEADNREEAERIFWENNEFSELDAWLDIKQFRLKRKEKSSQ